jgi:DNA polymerase-4
MWGVGKKSAEVLSRIGVSTIGDLQKLSFEYLCSRFGKQGGAFFYMSRGIDDRIVEEDDSIKSISREHTFSIDCKNVDEWKNTLHSLAQDVARRARHRGVKGHTVFLTYRTPDFNRHSIRRKLSQPTNVSKLIYDLVLQLLDEVKEKSLRLIGVGITGLDENPQLDLFSELSSVKTLEASEIAVDQILKKFGSDIISKGLEVKGKKKSV